MKKHTVTAGLIAGIVVACSGPGLEAMGGMMHDAGHSMSGAGGSLANAGRRALSGGSSGSAGEQLIADAGNVLADAGQMLADAGQTIASAGHSSVDSGKAQEAGDGLPRAHWILRDKNGTPVKADVYPIPSKSEPAFTNASSECVGIQYFGSRHIGGLYYSLAQGKLGGCAIFPPSDSWRTMSAAYFVDASCSGQTYYTSAVWSFTFQVAGVNYYTDGLPTMPKVMNYYHWNTTTQKCDASTSAMGQDLWAFKPVPADIINLLPNAPYTLELVY